MGLLLGRKIDESILIGRDIRVTVTKAAKGHTRLYIEAPAHVAIVREEIANEFRGVMCSGGGSVCVPRVDGVGNQPNTDHATLVAIANIAAAALHVDVGHRRYADALSAIGQLLDERG